MPFGMLNIMHLLAVQEAVAIMFFVLKTLYACNGVASIFVWGGPLFHDLRRPTIFGGGGGSTSNFQGSP